MTAEGRSSEARWRSKLLLSSSIIIIVLAYTLLTSGSAGPLDHVRFTARIIFQSSFSAKHMQSAVGNAPQSSSSVVPPEVAWACSEQMRSENAAKVRDGAAPSLLDFSRGECEGIQTCTAESVARLIESYRLRQQHHLLTMVPCDLYRLFQGQTLWIIGDSQQKYFYNQLACFLKDFQKPGAPAWFDPAVDKQTIAKLVAHCPHFECLGEGYRKCCSMGKGPVCSVLVGGTRICYLRINRGEHVAEHLFPHFSLLNITTKDVVVLNFGLWHTTKNSGFVRALRRVVKHYKAHRTMLPTMIWRDVAAQHFSLGSATGEFPDLKPGDRDKIRSRFDMTCSPLEGATLLADGTLQGHNTELLEGGLRNAKAAPLVRWAGMPILATWNETVPLHDMHKTGECTHYCSPGAYSVWIWRLWLLLSELVQGRTGQDVRQTAVHDRRP